MTYQTLRFEPGLIAFEGLDATGKTSLTQQLITQMAARRFQTPDEPYASLRALLHEQPGSASYLMYLSSCAYAVHQHRVSPEPISLADRYFFSSLVYYAFAQRLDDRGVDAHINLCLSLLPPPALTVLTLSRTEVRLFRLANRVNGVSFGNTSAEFECCWLRCAERLEHRLGVERVIRLDTSDLEIEAGAAALRETLLTHLSNDLSHRRVRMVLLRAPDGLPTGIEHALRQAAATFGDRLMVIDGGSACPFSVKSAELGANVLITLLTRGERSQASHVVTAAAAACPGALDVVDANWGPDGLSLQGQTLARSILSAEEMARALVSAVLKRARTFRVGEDQPRS